MRQDQTHQDEAVRFLLGQLSEAEQSAFEDRFFEDDKVFEELKIVEEELIELYLDGRMEESQRESFERQIATTPTLRERVVFAKMLGNKADATALAPAVVPVSPSWWERFWGSAIFQRPAYRMAFVTALLLIVLGGIGWMVRQSRLENERLEAQRKLDEQQRMERQREEEQRTKLQQQQTAEVPPDKQSLPPPTPGPSPASTRTVPGGFATVILVPGSSRSTGGSGNTLKVEANQVGRVRLTFMIDDASYPSYLVEFTGLQTKKTFTREARSGGESSIAVEVAASMLPIDDYTIKVIGISSQGTRETVNNYMLNVRRK